MFSYLADKLNIQQIGELLAPTLTPEQELHAAIENGLQEKVLHLLDEGNVSPYAENAGGNKPIHTASYYGRVAIIETLLMRGVDVNLMGPRDNTPLHFAASQNRMDAVKFLITNGANPALRNRHGRTPYDIAQGDNVRQYLLPLQFRHEDPSVAMAMLPAGITPTTDSDAPRPVYAPPPTDGMMMQNPMQPQEPINPLFAPPTHSAIPRRPSARVTTGTYRPIQADGFGTSVGNEELTAKYGNTREVRAVAPPPPSLGDVAAQPISAPGGANPYSVTRAVPSPPHSSGAFPGYGPPSGGMRGAAPQFKIFNPKLVATNTNGGLGAAPNAGAAPYQAPYAHPPTAPIAQFASPAAVPGNIALAPPPTDFPLDGATEEVTLSANANVLQ